MSGGAKDLRYGGTNEDRTVAPGGSVGVGEGKGARAGGPGARVGRTRWALSAALGVSVMVAYLDRLNIWLSLPAIGRDLGWTTAEIGARGGLLLGVFFLGYGLSNIFLSPLAARFGVRRSLMTIVVLFSLFTALGAPLAGSLVAFAAVRLLLGVSEGVHFPIMVTATKAWFPASERSRGNAVWLAGGLLATVLAPLVVVPLISATSWQTMLVVLGLLGMLVTLPLLWLFVYDTPRSSPRTGEAEVAYVEAGLEREEPAEPGGLGFLRLPAFWLLLVSSTCNNYVVFGTISWLPTYFSEGRGLPFEELSYVAALPYLVGLPALFGWAWLGDRTNRRALTGGIGFLLAGACVAGAASAPGLAPTIALFSAATLFQNAYVSQDYALLQRLLPRLDVSKGAGVFNGVAVLVGGVLGSVVIGGVVALTGSFTAGILTIVAASAVGGVSVLTLSRTVRY